MLRLQLDRQLPIAFIVAIIFHTLLIMGISFEASKMLLPKSLEVTLAIYKSNKAQDKVDYIAQFDQEGSGTLKNKALLQTDRQSEFQSNEMNEVVVKPTEAQTLKQEEQSNRALISTASKSKHQVNQHRFHFTAAFQRIDEKSIEKLANVSREIASLQARYDEQRQKYAKRPKIKRLTTVSAKGEVGAYYKELWRKKVEQIGNQNYPRVAKQNKIYGELRLLVSIKKDGSLFSTEVLQSSGHDILDASAIRIVKLSAPFPAFQNKLKEYDRVEIIRTWKFEKSNRLTSR